MKEARQAIKAALEQVTPQNAPRIYEAVQTENGYKNIEDRILNMMIDYNFTASACIPQLEETL